MTLDYATADLKEFTDSLILTRGTRHEDWDTLGFQTKAGDQFRRAQIRYVGDFQGQAGGNFSWDEWETRLRAAARVHVLNVPFWHSQWLARLGLTDTGLRWADWKRGFPVGVSGESKVLTAEWPRVARRT